MRRAEIRRILADSMEEALEKMFFMDGFERDPDAAPAAALLAAARVAEARVDFGGTLSGRLSLRIPASAALSMAADFLGEDQEGVSDARAGEVLCELANMICGAALSRLEDRGEFRLCAPVWAANSEPDALARGVRQAIRTGDGRFEAILELEDGICRAVEKSAS